MSRFRTFDLVDENGKRKFTGYPYAEAVAEREWMRRAAGQFLRIVKHKR